MNTTPKRLLIGAAAAALVAGCLVVGFQYFGSSILKQPHPRPNVGVISPKSPLLTSPSEAPPKFPNETTTGWRHTGVALRRVHEGDKGPGWYVARAADIPWFYVTQPGVTVDSLDIPFCVKVMADDVTIRRSRITCSDYYLIRTIDPPRKFHGLVLEDDEIDGKGDPATASIAVMETPGARYTRLDVHGMGSSGPRLGSDNVIEDSYLHDFTCAPGIHTAGLSANGGGIDIVVRHNNISIDQRAGCATASWELARDFGTYRNVLVEGNLFNGGSYCAYAGISVPGSNFGPARHVVFRDNTFGRQFSPECGGYGPVAQFAYRSGAEWIGNVWGGGRMATNAHRTGSPVSPY